MPCSRFPFTSQSKLLLECLPAVEETVFGQFWIGHVDQTTELVLNIDDSVHV